VLTVKAQEADGCNTPLSNAKSRDFGSRRPA
jgi:hypothetical protein